MKLFVVACLAVAVMAEADPNLVLTNGVYPTVYNTPLVHPVVSSPLVQPLVSSYIQPTVKIMKEEEKKEEVEQVEEKVEAEKPKQMIYTSPFYPTTYINPIQPVVVGPRYVSKNGEVEHIVAKREADPAWLYSNWAQPLTYTNWAYPNVYAANKATFVNPFTGDVTGKVTNDAILPNNYANKGRYVAQAPGSPTVHIAKREADPLTIIPNMYSYVRPAVYTTNYVRPVVYNRPVVYKTPLVTPTGVEGVVNGKTVADDAWQFTPGYAGKGQYLAKNPGAEHRAKREADPALLYRTYGYPYANYYNTPLRTTYTTPYVSSFYNNYPYNYYY